MSFCIDPDEWTTLPTGFESVFTRAKDKGILSVCSAGNDGKDVQRLIPASYQDRYTYNVTAFAVHGSNYRFVISLCSITVAACDKNDKFWTRDKNDELSKGSNYGKCVDMTAPVSLL